MNRIYREKAWLEKQIKKGGSFGEIAKQVGVTRMTIYNWIKRYGLLSLKKESSRKKVLEEAIQIIMDESSCLDTFFQ